MRKHIEIAITVLGRKLPKGTEVHHVDCNPNNNRNDNLVICQDRRYHRFIHKRLRGYNATGNPNAVMCRICKEYDVPGDNGMVYKEYKNDWARVEHITCAKNKHKGDKVEK